MKTAGAMKRTTGNSGMKAIGIKRQLTYVGSYLILLCNGAISQIQEDADVSTSLIAQFHQELEALHSNMSNAFSDVKLEIERTSVASDYLVAPDKVVVWVEHGKFRVKTYQHPKRLNGDIHVYEESFDGKKYYTGEPNFSWDDVLPADMSIWDPFSNSISNSIDYLNMSLSSYLHYAGVHTPSDAPYMQNLPYFGSRLEHLLKKGESVSVDESDGNIIVKCEVPDYKILWSQKLDIKEERWSLSNSPMSKDDVDSIISAMEKDMKAVPKRKIEIHLDPDYGFAPVYMLDNSMDGRKTNEVRAEDWKHYKDYDIWLPGTVTSESVYDSEMYRNIYRLKDLEFRFEDNVNYDLREEYYDKPATRVTQHIADPEAKVPAVQVEYSVGTDGELTKKSPEAIIAEINRSKKFRLLILAIIVMTLGTIVYTWKKQYYRYGK